MGNNYEILGLNIDDLTYDEILEKINNIISSGEQSYIVTVNPEIVVTALRDKDYFKVINSSKIKTADGIGILWASDYLGKPLHKGKLRNLAQLIMSLFSIIFFSKRKRQMLANRITGADLLPKIAEASQNKGWRIFLLGASEGVAETVIKKLSSNFQKANFVGCYSGSPDVKGEQIIKDYINRLKPDILFVAYGSPNQERWIYRNLKRLPSVKVAIGVGGAFDFHSGKITRPTMDEKGRFRMALEACSSAKANKKDMESYSSICEIDL